jgi:hypothetical protein
MVTGLQAVQVAGGRPAGDSLAAEAEWVERGLVEYIAERLNLAAGEVIWAEGRVRQLSRHRRLIPEQIKQL